jgi:hypothetical protein
MQIKIFGDLLIVTTGSLIAFLIIFTIITFVLPLWIDASIGYAENKVMQHANSLKLECFGNDTNTLPGDAILININNAVYRCRINEQSLNPVVDENSKYTKKIVTD